MARESEGKGGYRAVLRSRDLRRLLTTELISASGSWAYNVALLTLLYDRTHSAAWVAVGALGKFIPALLCSGYGGVIAERFERVRLMTWLNIGAFVLQAGLAVAAWRMAPAVVLVFLAAATQVILSPYIPSVTALIPQVVNEDELAAANALSATIDNVVVVVGPAVGGLLLIVGGPQLAIAVNALTFAIAASMLPGMTVRSSPSDVTSGGTAGPLRQVADGFKALGSSASVATFTGFCMVVTFVYGTDVVLFAPIAKIQVGWGSSGYGYLLAGLGVGGIVGAAFISRLAARQRLAAAVYGGTAAYCLPTALLIVIHQPAAAFIFEVIRGAGTLVVDTLAITALQRSASKEMVARVFGAFYALVFAMQALGSLVAAGLLSAAGLHLTMLIIGVGIPAACLLAVPLLARSDRIAAANAASLLPRVAILERQDLFRAATRTSLEGLAAAATEITVPAGTVVVAEGDEADAFYAVTGGLLDVFAIGEGHAAPVHLRELGPGTYFGEIGLLGHMPRTATVTAKTECTLLRIPGNDFLDALTRLSASTSLLAGAQARLAVTHPKAAARRSMLVPAQQAQDGAEVHTSAGEA